MPHRAVPSLGDADVHALLHVMRNTPRCGEVPQIICILQCIHVKRVTRRYTEVDCFEHFRRETHFTKCRLCRNRIHIRHRAVAHQPASSSVVHGPGPKSAERVMVKFIFVVQPVLEADRGFKGRVCRLHEIQFIYADDGESAVDVWHRRFTHTDARNVR